MAEIANQPEVSDCGDRRLEMSDNGISGEAAKNTIIGYYCKWRLGMHHRLSLSGIDTEGFDLANIELR